MVLDFFLLGLGVYILYLAVKMKNTGEIPLLLINRRINLERSKNKEGYIKFMVPRTISFAITLIVFASMEVIVLYWKELQLITSIVHLVYIAVIIYFCIVTIKAQNKYLF